MFNQGKVLLATDFSKAAEKLSNGLPELKNIGIKEVLILQVLETDIKTKTVEYAEEIDKRLLKKCKEKVENMGLEASIKVEEGEPADKIVSVANEENCNLILMGSHGGGVIKDVFLGSTTHDVIRKSNIPVLIEKYEELETKDLKPIVENKFEDILLPVDFSDSTTKLLDVMKKISTPSEKTTIVSIIESSNSMEKLKEKKNEVRTKLEEIKRELAANNMNCNCNIEVRNGDAAQNIIEIAEEKESNLIIISDRGQNSLKDLLIGSTAEQIARKSPIPVLLVPSNK